MLTYFVSVVAGTEGDDGSQHGTAEGVPKVVKRVISILNGILRLFNVEPKNEATSAFTLDEVATIVEQATKEGHLADVEVPIQDIRPARNGEPGRHPGNPRRRGVSCVPVLVSFMVCSVIRVSTSLSAYPHSSSWNR
jgi:hypothetical protein